MDAKIITDILQQQDNFVQMLQKQIELVVKAGPEAVLAEKEMLHAQFKERMQTLQAARQQALERYDAEIGRHQTMIAQLEKEIADHHKKLGKTVNKKTGQVKQSPSRARH